MQGLGSNWSKTETLPDGRKMGYVDGGNTEGFPLFIIHGLPGSRLDALYIGEHIARSQEIRFIVPDRPALVYLIFIRIDGYWITLLTLLPSQIF
jgi:hypothetical protein